MSFDRCKDTDHVAAPRVLLDPLLDKAAESVHGLRHVEDIMVKAMSSFQDPLAYQAPDSALGGSSMFVVCPIWFNGWGYEKELVQPSGGMCGAQAKALFA